MRSHPVLLYGGLVVLACLASTLVNGGVLYTLGIFFKPVMEDMGWSRSQLSAVNSLLLVSYAPGAIFLGRFSDRYGARLPMGAAALLIGTGMALNSRAQGFGLFLFDYILIGLGVGVTLAVPGAVVQRWFVKGRGIALGLVAAGSGMGALVFSPVANQLIFSYGWRSAYLILALVFSGLLTLSALFLLSSPSSRGMAAYGEAAADPVPEVAMSLSRAMGNATFRGLVLIAILSFAPIFLLIVHLVPYITDRGLSPAVAAGAVGMIGATSTLGRLMGGSLAERIGWMRGLALSNFVCALGIAWLMALSSPAMLYPFVVVFGFFYGARISQLMGSISFLFGTSSLGTLLGTTLGMSTLLGSFSPLLGGYLFDLTGSYTLAWIFVMACLIAAGVYSLSIRTSFSRQGSSR